MTGEGQWTLTGEAGGGWSGPPASVLGLCSGLTGEGGVGGHLCVTGSGGLSRHSSGRASLELALL